MGSHRRGSGGHLFTLLGAGGVGKSRLAVGAGRRLCRALMGHVEAYAGGRPIKVDVVHYNTPAIAA